jgi:hypothetical protein
MRRVYYEILSLSKNGEIIPDVVSFEDSFNVGKYGVPPTVSLDYVLKDGKTVHVDCWNYEGKMDPPRYLYYSGEDVYTIHLVEKAMDGGNPETTK